MSRIKTVGFLCSLLGSEARVSVSRPEKEDGGGVAVTREGIKTEPEKPSIQTCPLLLRGFTKDNGHHHHMDEFSCRNVPSASCKSTLGWMQPLNN